MSNTQATSKDTRTKRKLFSYVVQHDTGYAPNPYFGVCTLCRCKYRKSKNKPQNIVERAKSGDWIVGTGGASKKSAGLGKIIYVMRVDKKIPRIEYYRNPTFTKKKQTNGGKQGDNMRPENFFEETQQFALISRHYWYFGKKAIPIPKAKFPDLEKKGPGFRSDFQEPYISRFTSWLEKHYKKRGRLGEPCWINPGGSSPLDHRLVKPKTICK
jgi:Nucleotide modification associated domain 2